MKRGEKKERELVQGNVACLRTFVLEKKVSFKRWRRYSVCGNSSTPSSPKHCPPPATNFSGSDEFGERLSASSWRCRGLAAASRGVEVRAGRCCVGLRGERASSPAPLLRPSGQALEQWGCHAKQLLLLWQLGLRRGSVHLY